ncbi:beta-lactamase family protein [Streptomyces sp. ISL-12]|uniref:serine hydrolase domain-containing protein n=1 Tax=Streptomyces sp. ISL-12 TaxID=2819177 RepID=UPI001BE894DC|nr:serine hydrolase domain-containing protein [Streptomyces sp. ISL-12]MBT2413302.1 beta-lactamase family protein [Streptomyces sp. ISL-12]
MRVTTAAVLAGVLAGSALPAQAVTQHGGRSADLRRLQDLVHEDGFPAALAAVRGRWGQTSDLTAGVGELRGRTEVPVDGMVRAGSNTKTFTAVVVLQLVGEGVVRLDAPIEDYLPGLVRGEGIDGSRITVRQLLQHTSGLPDYVSGLDDFFAIRDTHYEPTELLDLALSRKAHFAPGTRWEYSNTNYLLAGLLVEEITGRTVAEEITRRVIRKAALRHTYFPAPGERTIREAHPHGYHATAPGAPLRDLTVFDPSWAGAAGQLVSTPRDLNRFFTALMDGKLLRAEQLRQMRTTVAAPGTWPGARYGLGLFSTPLSCGGLVWGHGGDIPGYETRGGVTEGGRAVTVAVTALPSAVPEPEAAAAHVLDFVDRALCG